MNTKNRKLDISAKLLAMGNALMVEGTDRNDINIFKTGTLIILIGSLILDDNDIEEFMVLCSMFSAKKILDDMEKDPKNNLSNYIKERGAKESYEDLIKRINKLRGKNDDDEVKS